MNRVKVGVIGVGLWGVNHVEAYLGLPHAEVVAVANPAPGRAKEIADTFHIPHAFEKGSLATELSYFLNCVIKEERPEVATAEEAREGIRIASALVESATHDKEVSLTSAWWVRYLVTDGDRQSHLKYLAPSTSASTSSS